MAGRPRPGPSFFESWCTFWVGDTIGVLIFAPLVLIAIAVPREIWKPRRWSVGVPVAVLCIAGVLLFLRANAWEQARLKLAFAQQAQHLANALVRSIDAHIDVLRAIEGLFAASHRVDRQEFGAFAEAVMARHPGFKALEWAPRVPGAQRAAYEAAVRQEGYARFETPKRMQRGGGSARRHARSISRSISWSPTAGTKPRSASTSPPSRSVAKPWSARTIPRRRSSRGA
jgi:hypothetical protein